MLGDINPSLKPPKFDIFLCLPNGNVISKLSEAYGKQTSPRLGNLQELTFKIPYQVDRQHKLVRNKNVDLLKERYIIKTLTGLKENYFIINQISDNDSGEEYRQVHAWQLPYELNDKKFRSYKKDAINATTALTEATSTSIWAVGTVDPDFDTVYRSFDFSSITALDFVFKIAETFKALIQWDTKNRLINLVKPESVGQNKGLKISYGKYLESIGRESSTDEMVTRLHVFGNENLSINRVNPTGTSYLENFSYFLYKFYREVYDPNNPNHTGKSQHIDPNTSTTYVTMDYSEYMSEELCHAIMDYDDLVESKKGQFSTYVSEKETLQSTLTTKENEMSALETEMWQIEDSLFIAQQNGSDTTQLETDKANKQVEIDAKQSEIDSVNADIDTVNSDISNLQSSLAIENNFTAVQIKERNMFIIESEWSDENYLKDTDLYEDAIKYFEILKQPQTVINMDIANFLSVIEEQRNWNKLSLGDTITIQHERLGIDVQAKIIEIQFDYESNGISLTIANVKDIQTDKEKVIKSLYRFNSTSTSVDMNKYKWNTVSEVDATLNDYMSNAIDAAKQAIIAGTNESVVFDRRGLRITNPDDPNRYIIQNHGIIALVKDGSTPSTAISADGIHAPLLIGEMIVGANLQILNSAGKFTFNQDGATLIDASMTFTKTDGKSKVIIDADNGFKIQKKVGTAFVDKLYTDINGTLVAEDLIAKRLQITDGSNGILIDANTKTIDFSKFTTIAGKLTSNNLIVQDLTNLNGNSELEFGGNGYSGVTYVTSGIPDSANNPTPGKAMKQTSRDGYWGDDFSVQPNEQFYVGGWTVSASTQSFNFGIRFTLSDGSYSWLVKNAGVSTQTTWKYHEDTITAPSNAVKGRVFYQIPVFDTFGAWYFTKTFVRRVGVLTADKINGGTLTGVVLESINGTDKVSIRDGSIFSYDNGKKMIDIANYNINFYDWATGSQLVGSILSIGNAINVANGDVGLGIQSPNFIELGSSHVDGYTLPAIRYVKSEQLAYLTGNPIDETTGWAFLSAIKKAGEGQFSTFPTIGAIDDGKIKGVMMYLGDKSTTPNQNDTSFRVYVNKGTGASGFNHDIVMQVGKDGVQIWGNLWVNGVLVS